LRFVPIVDDFKAEELFPPISTLVQLHSKPKNYQVAAAAAANYLFNLWDASGASRMNGMIFRSSLAVSYNKDSLKLRNEFGRIHSQKKKLSNTTNSGLKSLQLTYSTVTLIAVV
jgi:hypothetical protein